MAASFVTFSILGLTILVSLLSFARPSLLNALQFNPYRIHHSKEWHRLVSHAFVHANIPHLFVNMLVFYFFGRNVEWLYNGYFGGTGTLFFCLLYLGGILFSTFSSFRKHRSNPHYNAVGASGAVAAVLFAHILLLPTKPVFIFFLPIPIPSFIFGVMYLLYERYMEKRTEDNVAHDAHFWGAVFGFLFTGLLKKELFLTFFDRIVQYTTSFL